jgi:hypothetical protein
MDEVTFRAVFDEIVTERRCTTAAAKAIARLVAKCLTSEDPDASQIERLYGLLPQAKKLVDEIRVSYASDFSQGLGNEIDGQREKGAVIDVGRINWKMAEEVGRLENLVQSQDDEIQRLKREAPSSTSAEITHPGPSPSAGQGTVAQPPAPDLKPIAGGKGQYDGPFGYMAYALDGMRTEQPPGMWRGHQEPDVVNERGQRIDPKTGIPLDQRKR